MERLHMGNEPGDHVEGSFPHSEALQQQADLAKHHLFGGDPAPDKNKSDEIPTAGLGKPKEAFIPAMSDEERKYLLSIGEVVPTTRLYRLCALAAVFFTLPPVLSLLFTKSNWFWLIGDNAGLVTTAGFVVYCAGFYAVYKAIWKYLCSLKGQEITAKITFLVVRISTFILLSLYLMQAMIFYFKMENPYEFKVALAVIISIVLAFFLSKKPIILLIPFIHIIWYLSTS